MKVFVILSCIALAVARPEAPGGYNYNQPSSSFGGSHGISAPAAPSFGLNTPGSAPAPSFSGSSSFGNSFSSGSSFGGSSFGGSSSFGSSALSPSFSSGQSFSSGSSFSSGPSFSAPAPSFQSFAQPQAQAIVQKHIYVHVPPPQDDEFQPQQFSAPPAPQKHYKIIFIKAPSPPTINRQQIQQLSQPQTEEKTLVYVLVKKPESISELNIQPAAPITPSKPEVYFIKYKAQKEQSFAAPAPQFPQVAAPQFSAPALPAPAPAPISSGSSDLSLPISAPQKPSPVYGPAH